MKFTLIFLATFVGLLNVAASTSVEIQISNTDQKERLYIYTPQGGTFFAGTANQQNSDSTGFKKLEFEIQEPGFCYLFSDLNFSDNSWTCIQIYLEPNAQYTINVDKNNPRSSLRIDGPNAELNAYLNQTVREHFPEPYLTTKVATEIYERLENAEQKEITAINELNQISDEAKNYALADVKFFYKNIFKDLIYGNGRTDNKNEIAFETEWVTLIKSKYLESDTGDKYACASIWYRDFLEAKEHFIKFLNMEGVVKEYIDLSQVSNRWKFLNDNFTKSELEVHVAHELLPLIRKYKSEENTILLFRKFETQYPNSLLLPHLQTEIQEGLDFYENAKNEISLETKDYQSLSQILDDSEAELIFLDVWASWCGPCKDDFSKSVELNAFVQKNRDKIEKLYITIDDLDKKETVENSINFYTLKGKHVLASASVRNEIYKLFGNQNGVLSLPTYALLKKDGTVINDNLPRPSDWANLKKALEGIITE